MVRPKKNEQRIKPLAVFDLDGTTFKRSVLEELVDELVSRGYYDEATTSKLADLKKRWEVNNTERIYLDYIQSMVESFITCLSGKTVYDVRSAAMAVRNSGRLRVRRFASEAIRLLGNTYHVVAISGSPQIAVELFTDQLGLAASFGSTLDDSNGVYVGTGRTIDKVEMIHRVVNEGIATLDCSVGFGDTFSDAPMLGCLDKAVCINPTSTLEIEARNRGWHIVRESKDTISHATPDGKYYGIQTTHNILERIGLTL